MKKTISAILLASICMACSTSNKVTGDSINGEWNVKKINGEAVKHIEDMDSPFIGFDTAAKRVYGSTGCNKLTGALSVNTENSNIDFSRIGSTRMMCHDMATESKMLDALSKANKYEVKNGKTLLLRNGNGDVVIQLQRKTK